MGVDTKLVIPTDLFVWSVKCVCSVCAVMCQNSPEMTGSELGCARHTYNAVERSYIYQP